jgi:hypothetical protein
MSPRTVRVRVAGQGGAAADPARAAPRLIRRGGTPLLPRPDPVDPSPYLAATAGGWCGGGWPAGTGMGS